MANVTFSVATEDELPDVYQFCVDNYRPHWQMCAGVPPYPTLDQLREYHQRGNPITIARNPAGAIIGYRVLSIDPGRRGEHLWAMAQDTGKPGEVTQAMLDQIAEGQAFVWSLFDGPNERPIVPERSTVSNENIAAALSAQALYDKAVAIYNAKYK